MASKMVVDRQARGADVLAALAVHGGEVADGLRREVGDAAGGVAQLQATLRRRLEGRLEALVAADEEHLAATGDLVAARRRRDAAARELYRLLVAVRKLAEGLYGTGAGELLRIEGRVAQRPVPMLRQARRVMARLADPAMTRPERRFASATADEGEWAELLAPAIEALAAALDSADRARRRAESTLLAKTEALAAYDLAHGRLARYGEALFELAGLPEYASRLRPRVRRRGRGASRRPPIELRQPVLHPVDQPTGEEHVDLARREVVAEPDLPVLALVAGDDLAAAGDDLATRRLPSVAAPEPLAPVLGIAVGVPARVGVEGTHSPPLGQAARLYFGYENRDLRPRRRVRGVRAAGRADRQEP
jgi:hypothetical protein